MTSACPVGNEEPRYQQRNQANAVGTFYPLIVKAPRNDAEARLGELETLEPGWNIRGDAEAITPEATAVARAFLAVTEHVPLSPWVGPSPDGGIHIVWAVGSRDVEVSIEPDGLHFLLMGGADESVELEANDRAQLVARVEALNPAT